jgi:hypothetical protein
MDFVALNPHQVAAAVVGWAVICVVASYTAELMMCVVQLVSHCEGIALIL